MAVRFVKCLQQSRTILRPSQISFFTPAWRCFLFFENVFISPSSCCLHVLPDVFLESILNTNYTYRVWRIDTRLFTMGRDKQR